MDGGVLQSSILRHSGWHLTYFGGGKAVSEKLRAFYAADTYAGEIFGDEQRLGRLARHGRAVYALDSGDSLYYVHHREAGGGQSPSLHVHPSLLPMHVQRNREAFAKHFHPPPESDTAAVAAGGGDMTGDMTGAAAVLPSVGGGASGERERMVEQELLRQDILQAQMSMEASGDWYLQQKSEVLDCHTLNAPCQQPGDAVAQFCERLAIGADKCASLLEMVVAHCTSNPSSASANLDVQIDDRVLVPIQVDGGTWIVELTSRDDPTEVAQRACTVKQISQDQCMALVQHMKEKCEGEGWVCGEPPNEPDVTGLSSAGGDQKLEVAIQVGAVVVCLFAYSHDSCFRT
jgi:hypothetical protein